MIVARQSTARTVTVGPVLDSSGAAVTTAVVGDFKLSKNGGAPAALNASATLTHRNTGHYSLALTASDTDTVGQAEVVIDATTNACPVKELTVVEEAVYDALFAASAVGYVADQPVNATKFGGTTVTGRDIGASVLLSSGTGTGQLKLASGYVAMTWADIAAPTTAVALTGTTIATTQKVDVETIKTQAVTCAAGVTVGVYVGGTGAAALEATAQSILTDTAEIGAAGAGLTDLGGMSTTMKAQVNTEVDAGIADARLDELLAADSDIDGAAPPAVGSVFHELMTKTAGSFTYDQTTDSLEALRDRGDAAWATATGFSTHTAADVWAVATRVLTAGTNVDGSTFTAVPWNAAWDAEVQSEVQDAIEANHLDHLLAATYDPAAKPGAADALLNELVESDAGVARFTANALEQGPSGGGGVADWTADERTALRSILGIPASGTTPDDPTAGILDTIRDAVAGVQSDTNDIQSRLPAALSGGNMPSVLADGAAHGGSTATLELGATGQSALYISSIGSGVAAAQVVNIDAGGVGLVARGGGTGGTGLLCLGATPISGNITANITGNLSGSTGDSADIDAIKAKTDNLPTDPADQSAVEAAITAAASGLATAANLATVAGYLDTEVAAILEDTGTTIPAQIAALNNLSAAQVAAAVPTAAQNAAAILAAGDVDGYSLEETLKICLAALAGKLSGAATATVVIRAADDSKARITATCDSSGNRSAITLDETG